MGNADMEYIVETIKANDKRMAKIEATPGRYRRQKAKNYIVGELATQHIKASDDDICRMVAMLTR